jgi:hypothetical protein
MSSDTSSVAKKARWATKSAAMTAVVWPEKRDMVAWALRLDSSRTSLRQRFPRLKSLCEAAGGGGRPVSGLRQRRLEDWHRARHHSVAGQAGGLACMPPPPAADEATEEVPSSPDTAEAPSSPPPAASEGGGGGSASAAALPAPRCLAG